MDTLAVVLEEPERIAVRALELTPAGDDDVVVQVEWSGVSTGTERLFWSGRMPPFPGMGYPLVPGYESVGRITATGRNVEQRLGEYVFIPGATCYKDARGLFGGAAQTLIAPASRVHCIQERLGSRGVLLALAATAHHAIAAGKPPDLIVGHGVLGRMLARLSMAYGAHPTVWEINETRSKGRFGYKVLHPDADERKDYSSIYDVSGDGALLDKLVSRLARGGEITLAGFYEDRLSFGFVPAFMREARIRVAAEWQPDDITAVQGLMRGGRFSLDNLITHESSPDASEEAYATAFGDERCLKMVLDWRQCA